MTDFDKMIEADQIPDDLRDDARWERREEDFRRVVENISPQVMLDVASITGAYCVQIAGYRRRAQIIASMLAAVSFGISPEDGDPAKMAEAREWLHRDIDVIFDLIEERRKQTTRPS